MKKFKTSLGLYIHIPFCKRRCRYCGFVSNVRRPLPEAAYIAALLREMEARADDFVAVPLASIYFGGGTPSLLAPATIGRLIQAARSRFRVRHHVEITLEANPESLDLAKLKQLRRAGINRLSLGVQTFSDRQLQRLGRVHTARQAGSAARQARKAGLQNLSLDLIFALPGQTLAELEADLEQALTLEPDHLSVYELTWEKGAELERLRKEGKLKPVDEDLAAEMFLLVGEKLAAAGLRRYEVSNFSRPGCECRHNLSGWQLKPYLGLGAAGHSLLPSGERQANATDLKTYLAQVKKTGKAVTATEPPDRERARREFILLGIRTAAGISRRDYRAQFGRDLWSDRAESIRALEEMKVCRQSRSRLQLTPKGFLLADAAALELI